MRPRRQLAAIPTAASNGPQSMSVLFSGRRPTLLEPPSTLALVMDLASTSPGRRHPGIPAACLPSRAFRLARERSGVESGFASWPVRLILGLAGARVAPLWIGACCRRRLACRPRHVEANRGIPRFAACTGWRSPSQPEASQRRRQPPRRIFECCCAPCSILRPGSRRYRELDRFGCAFIPDLRALRTTLVAGSIKHCPRCQ